MQVPDSLQGGTLIHPLTHLMALSALCMWPLGYLQGLNVSFHWLFLIHCFLLVAAVGVSLLYIYRCALRSLWPSLFVVLCICLFVGGGSLEFLYAMSDKEVFSGDLFVAHFWNTQERIQYSDLGWHVPSHYPNILRASLVEALRLFPWWGIALYQGLFCLVAAGLTCHVVYQETHSPESSVLASLLLLSVPLGFCNASIAFGLGASVLFTALFFSHALNWAQGRGGFFTISACGFALGYMAQSHYIALALVPVAFFFLFTNSILLKRTFSGTFISIFWVSTLLVVLLAPVLISNLIFTGNPIYPLAKDYLGGDFYHGKILFDPVGSAFEFVKFGIGNTYLVWKQFLSFEMLLRVMCVVLGIAASFFWMMRHGWMLFTTLSIVVYILIITTYFPISYTFLLAIAPLACAVAAVGIVQSSKLLSKQYWPLLCMLALVIQFVIFGYSTGVSLASESDLRLHNNTLASAQIPRAAGDLGAAIEYINNDSDVDRVLLVCMPKAFLQYTKPIIAIDRYDSHRFAKIIRSVGSEHEIFYDLSKKYSISHMAVDTKCMRNVVENMLPERGRKRFANFVQRYLVNVYSNKSYDVFRLDELKNLP